MNLGVLERNIVVGVSDLAVSNDMGANLVTYSLGSCLGITVHDAEKHVGGLLHVMLPSSGIDKSRAQRTPTMFVDSGIPMLFRAAYELGADKKRMIVKVFGGAQVMDEAGIFNIGQRNYEALVSIFNRNRVTIRCKYVGGQICRTIRLSLSSGSVVVKSPGEEDLVV